MVSEGPVGLIKRIDSLLSIILKRSAGQLRWTEQLSFGEGITAKRWSRTSCLSAGSPRSSGSPGFASSSIASPGRWRFHGHQRGDGVCPDPEDLIFGRTERAQADLGVLQWIGQQGDQLVLKRFHARQFKAVAQDIAAFIPINNH